MKNKNTIIKSSVSTLLVIGILLVLFTSKNSDRYFDIQQLNGNCPPGFKLNEDNECIAKNLYQQYDSPNNQGVGGLQTGLPSVRDGFTPQEIDLGRYLFFDPVLSLDGSVSCASCHDPNKGFSDGLPTSVGFKNQKLVRSAPSLWNVAYLTRLFWDGRANSLEEQLEGSLLRRMKWQIHPKIY